jgi:hypothetical protein
MSSEDLKYKIAELQEELRKVEQKEKTKKGVLKFGEFCLVTFYEYNEDDRKVPSECDPVVFFMPWGQDNPVPMQECYIDWYTPYFVDLKNCANRWEEIKVKKISREEAFYYLNGGSK